MWNARSANSAAVVVALLAIGVDIGLARLGFGLLLPAIRRDLGGGMLLHVVRG